MYVTKMLDGREKKFSSEKAYHELCYLEMNDIQPLEVAGFIDEDEFWDVFKNVALRKISDATFTYEDIEEYVS